LYVADLDAIGGARPNERCIGALAEAGFKVWLDAGVRTPDDARKLKSSGAAVLVVGSETLAGPEQLARIVDHWAPESVVFSLDLKGGKPVVEAAQWRNATSATIVEHAWRGGVLSVLILDLAQVGCYTGVESYSLLEWCKAERPESAVYVGGGVRGKSDLSLLARRGAAGALVCSALHDGRLTPGDVAELWNGAGRPL
jgi:phosphoribosylformimino-5-aminoimidazole carboxamide ribotide isomerase